MFSFGFPSDLKPFRSLVEEEDQHMKLSLGSSEMGLFPFAVFQGWNHASLPAIPTVLWCYR